MSHLKWFTTATPWSVQMKPWSTELEQTSQLSIVDLAVTGSKEMISCIKILIYRFPKYKMLSALAEDLEPDPLKILLISSLNLWLIILD